VSIPWFAAASAILSRRRWNQIVMTRMPRTRTPRTRMPRGIPTPSPDLVPVERLEDASEVNGDGEAMEDAASEGCSDEEGATDMLFIKLEGDEVVEALAVLVLLALLVLLVVA
jgi:hypothetical protein